MKILKVFFIVVVVFCFFTQALFLPSGRGGILYQKQKLHSKITGFHKLPIQ